MIHDMETIDACLLDHNAISFDTSLPSFPTKPHLLVCRSCFINSSNANKCVMHTRYMLQIFHTKFVQLATTQIFSWITLYIVQMLPNLGFRCVMAQGVLVN